MARTRGGGLGAQGRLQGSPRGRGRGRGAQADRMDIVERVENINRSRNIPWNRSPLEAFVSNERSDGHTHGAESGQGSSMS